MGGLRILNIDRMNKALVAKSGWKLLDDKIQSPPDMWPEVLMQKL